MKRAVILTGLTIAAGLLFLSGAPGQQVHRYGFEVRETVWLKGSADAVYQESLHVITDQAAHTGQFSEQIQLAADAGNFIYYEYPTGRAPIADELNASVWVRANRPGTQLLARLVLPRERKPENLDEPLTTLLRGDTYQLTGRWQRLELRRPVKLAREQQQLMRAELKRDVNFDDAYIDRLVLNLYSGPGPTEAWIDDLEVGPVLDAKPFHPTSRASEPKGKPNDTATDLSPRQPSSIDPERTAIVELNQDHLLVNGKRFFFRGIRHTDTPLKALRDAGFNTIFFDYTASPGLLEEAVNLGFWLVPSLPVTVESRQLSAETVGQEVTRFPQGAAVLFWELGGGLTFEQASPLEKAARAVRQADPQRPLGADVWDGFTRYCRSVDLVGVHRWPLMTGLDLGGYYDWLDQRRRLARPGTFTWTWIQTHLPDWYTQLVYNRPSTQAFTEPVGPQPEQIRLLTYLAIAAGCRGVGFWSDRFLADSHQGRDRLLALALLNLELQMLEPYLVSVLDPPTWIETSVPEVKAAVLRTEKGVLVLPIYLAKGSQYVVGQSAAARMNMIVPQVPVGTQAWEITPAEVRSLPIKRVVGGTEVALPEFGLTTAILFTSDIGPNGMRVRLQEQARRMQKMAAQWAHDLAAVQIEKVLKVDAELQRQRHPLSDGAGLQASARGRLQASVNHWNNGDYRQAYQEAQRAQRPLRILMRGQWEQAVQNLDSPVASPAAVSFFSLPQHWRFMDEVTQTTPGENVLPGGDFEQAPEQSAALWTPQEVTMDEVELSAQRVEKPISPPAGASSKEKEKAERKEKNTLEPKEGKQFLMLQVKAPPKTGADGKPLPPPAVLERTFLAIHSPAVQLPAGSLVRVSGWVKVPDAIRASADGALFFDSAGGEPLAVRLTAATDWKQFSLYRRVPSSGRIHVTLALTGLGSVCFDDIRIEPLLPRSTVLSGPAR